MMKSKKKMLAGVLGSMSILALFIASAYAEGVNEHYVEDHTISDGIRATIEHQDDPSNVLNYVSDSGKNITIGKGIYGYRIGNIHTESVNEINVRSGGGSLTVNGPVALTGPENSSIELSTENKLTINLDGTAEKPAEMETLYGYVNAMNGSITLDAHSIDVHANSEIVNKVPLEIQNSSLFAFSQAGSQSQKKYLSRLQSKG